MKMSYSPFKPTSLGLRFVLHSRAWSRQKFPGLYEMGVS